MSSSYYIHISTERIDGFDIFYTHKAPIYYRTCDVVIGGFNGYIYVFNSYLYLEIFSDPDFSNDIVDLATNNSIEYYLKSDNEPYSIELRPLIKKIGKLVCFYHSFPDWRNHMVFYNKYHSSSKIVSINDCPSVFRTSQMPIMITSPTI